MSFIKAQIQEAVDVIDGEGIELRPFVKQWLAERALSEFGYVPNSDTPDSGDHALMLDLIDQAREMDNKAAA